MERKNSLLKHTIAVAIVIVLSKFLGLLRESMIAALYGATAETDAFFFAQSMPGTIFPAVCSSLSTAFISLYTRKIVLDEKSQCNDYASRIVTFTFLISIFLGGIGIWIVVPLVPILAPGFEGTQEVLAIRLSQIAMGSFPLLMLHYMLTAILNSKQRFVGSQIASLFYNITILALTAFLGSNSNVVVLSGVVVSGLAVQALALAVCCWGRFRYRPFQRLRIAESSELLRLAGPILLGNSIVQIHSIVDKALGSLMGDGALSALSYGNTLGNLVVSVLVTSLTTVLYPNLSANIAEGNREKYEQSMVQSLGGLTFIMIPILGITCLCSRDIVQIVYGRGSFNTEAITSTAVVLACYAPMFVACSVREVLTRGYFALQDTKTPMFNSAVGVVCNIVLSLALAPIWGIAGITIGTSVSTSISAMLLLRSIKHKMPQLNLRVFGRGFRNQCIAATLTFLVVSGISDWLAASNAFLHFMLISVVFFALYGAGAWLMNGKRLLPQ